MKLNSKNWSLKLKKARKQDTGIHITRENSRSIWKTPNSDGGRDNKFSEGFPYVIFLWFYTIWAIKLKPVARKRTQAFRSSMGAKTEVLKHVLQMSDLRLPNAVLHWHPPSTHQRGRPQNTLRYNYQEDLYSLNTNI